MPSVRTSFALALVLLCALGCGGSRRPVEDAGPDRGGPVEGTGDAGADGGDPRLEPPDPDAGSDAAVDGDMPESREGGAPAGDRDGDGVRDEDDAFPDDPSEWANFDGDRLGDNADPDDDNDGSPDEDDRDDRDPFVCSDSDGDGCDDCAEGYYAPANDGPDLDSDGICDAGDPDDDGDGVDDVHDAEPRNRFLCGDADADGCDDCASGAFDTAQDGLDGDGDGVCDRGDAFPASATQCRDTDEDGCDDCASGRPDRLDDGPDFDGNGICDAGDADDDGDGSPDDEDEDDRDRFVCSDRDQDGCEDCSRGTFDLAGDGPDSDGDGRCDAGDSAVADPYICADQDGDGCEDCSSGAYDPAHDGDDFDRDGLCDPTDPDDDIDGVMDDADNCVFAYNPAQIDQNADGVGDICDPAPCPGGGCLPHCKALYDARGARADGHYAIDPDGDGGRDPLVAYCYMNEAGGGWTVVLNYVHRGGTNPELVVLEDSLPRVSLASALFLFGVSADESGTPFWGHAGSALLADLEPAEVRFVGRTHAPHGRMITFTTRDAPCIAYLTSGSGSCRDVASSFVAAASHSAFLPGAADSGAADQGDYALTELPFYRAAEYHWAIRAEGRRWEVDDRAGDGAEHDTLHMVWVRQRALPSSCHDVLQRDRTAGDGVYTIDVDGWGGHEPLQVYCDMTTDGGGWTKILQYGDAAYTPTAGAVGDIATATADGFAKLADAHISALASLGSAGALYRIAGNRSDANVYVASAGAFDDTSPGWGVLGASAGAIAACQGAALDGCAFTEVAAPANLDTLAWGLSGDGCDRYLADPAGSIGCVEPASSEQRCVSAGAACAADGHAGHALVEQLALWIRPSFRSCRDILDATAAGAGDGVYPVDPDGPSGLAPFDVYCDMTTDGGGWTLIGKTSAGDYRALSDAEFIDLVANPIEDVNPALLVSGGYPETGEIAFWDRAKTNALYHDAGGRVVRVRMVDSGANSHEYFQQKLSPPSDWDFWHALRNARLWNDDGAVEGEYVTDFGIDFVLAGASAGFDAATNRVTHAGDGSFGWYSEAELVVNGGGMLSVSRHMGLLNDGYANMGWQWLLTIDPMDLRWKNDLLRQRALIWLR